MARIVRWYGSGPLHLLVLVASFALTGYAMVRLFAVRPWEVAIWFVGAAILHDLILLPLYSLADLSALSVLRHRAAARTEAAVDQPPARPCLPVRSAPAGLVPPRSPSGGPLPRRHRSVRQRLPRPMAGDHRRTLRSLRRGLRDETAPPEAGLPQRQSPTGRRARRSTVTTDEDEQYDADGEPYALALRPGREPVYLRLADGRRIRMPVHRWHEQPTAADTTVLERCIGPVLDVGCGPGRMCRALLSRGVFALGVDIAPRAVALTTSLGGLALCRSVFDRLLDRERLADGAAHRRQHRHRRRPSWPAAPLRRARRPHRAPRRRGRPRRRRAAVHRPVRGPPRPERSVLSLGTARATSAPWDRRQPCSQRHRPVGIRPPTLPRPRPPELDLGTSLLRRG
ncbi:hypothetical protein ACQ4WX_37550 [Streptomyces lasalocidi]